MDEEADVCEGTEFEIDITTSETGIVLWSTNGDGIFDNPLSTHINYTPGEQDIMNGTVTLTVNAISPYGCGDATRDLVLTTHPITHSEFAATSCVAYNWNGIEYTEEGDYEQTLQTVYGCDSIVTLHLSLVDFLMTETEMTACDSYVWAGETYIESGDYEKTFSSLYGCDSIVTMHLTINELSTTNLTVEACDSYEWNDEIFEESGIYTKTFTNVMGCDSIVNLCLIVNKTPAINVIEGPNEVDVLHTPSSTYTAVGELFQIDEYIWIIEPAEAGSITTEMNKAIVVWSDSFKGTATLKVTAANPCGENTSNLSVNVKNSTDVAEYGIETKIYPNPTRGLVTVEAEGLRQIEVLNTLGQRVATATGKGETLRIDISQLPAGIYFVNVTDGEGRKCVRKVVKE
jgi:hypothetical protein